MEGRRLDAGFFLAGVVVEEQEGLAAEQDDGYEVTDGHEGHRDVREVPHGLERGEGTEDDHSADEQAISIQRKAALRDEADVRFSIIVISNDAAECEQQDGYGDDVAACRADLRRQGLLRELYAVQAAVERHAAAEDDEGGAGADEDGVCENSQSLDKSLTHRM